MRLEMINIDDLRVDTRAQRELKDPHAAKIASKFDIRMFGSAIISERDGEQYILDAQHRIEAAKLSGYKGKIPALVHDDLTIAEEAGMFLALNDKKAVDPVDKFNARVTSGDPRAVEVDKVMASVGFGIAPVSATVSNQRAVQAVSSVEGVYAKHGDRVLAGVFMIISQAWPSLPKESRSGRIISALGSVIAPEIGADEDRIVEKLRTTTAGTLLADANYLAEAASGTSVRKSDCDIDAILKAYNKGLKRAEWVARPD